MIGKWTGYYEGEQTYSDGTESFTGEVTIDYYSDGTYTEKGHDSTHDSTYTDTGSWTQNGNTIRRQNSDGATSEETINMDNISGTDSGSNKMGSFRSSWSLSRVNM